MPNQPEAVESLAADFPPLEPTDLPGRPPRHGDITSLVCLVPKPIELVAAIDCGLPAGSRRLVGALLASAWRELELHPAARHLVRPATLRRAIGLQNNYTRRLPHLLQALATEPVSLPYLRRGAGGSVMRVPILAAASIESRFMSFAFSPKLAECISEPRRWALVDLAVLRALSGYAAPILYENLAQRRAQRRPVWRASLPMLRHLFGAKQDADWSSIRRHLLDPALQRGAEATGWRLDCGPEIARYSRAVAGVVITIVEKPNVRS